MKEAEYVYSKYKNKKQLVVNKCISVKIAIKCHECAMLIDF